MEPKTECTRLSKSILALFCLTGFLTFAAVQDVHVVAGVVTGVDKDAKTISVKTADGTEQVFKYGEKTAVRGYHEAAQGAKRGALDTYFAGKEGTHVVVHYSEKGSDKIASSVDDLGKDTVKRTEGTITQVDKKAHRVTIKGEDGAEETCDFGKDAEGIASMGS